MSSFNSINTMSSALRAFQRELDVTGHNIANVNTPGYSRQNVKLKADHPYLSGGQFLGGGVTVATVERVRDMFLEGRQQEIGAELGRLGAHANGLGRIEEVVGEPGNDPIGEAMTKFFDAWSALANSPNQPAFKQAVQSAGQTLADRLRSAHSQLGDLAQEQTQRATNAIDEVNQYAKRLNDLNAEIRTSAAAGGAPNDLFDQRDSILQEISKRVDVRVQRLADGSASVSIDQHALVSPGGVNALPTTPIDPASGTVGSSPSAIRIQGGQVKGFFDAHQSATSAQGRLDRIAGALGDGVNAIYSGGAAGAPFFTGTGAANLDLTAAIKANSGSIAPGASTAAGDGAIARQLSNFRNQPATALGGRSLGDEYSDFVAGVGRDAKAGAESLDTQKALASQLEAQVQSVSGVSLDDEMANMLRFQRSYQAAAKALSSFDSMFDDLMSIVR